MFSSKFVSNRNVKNKLILNIGNISNIGDNDYQQESRVLYSFVPDKPLSSLLEILSF